jgi:hypothetical protein
VNLMNRSSLADPIDAADTLLNACRSPWHLEMNDEPASLLEIQPFAGCISGKQYPRRAGGECMNDVGSLGRRQASVQLTGVNTRQRAGESEQRVSILGENDCLLVRTTQQSRERPELAGFSGVAGQREDSLQRLSFVV